VGEPEQQTCPVLQSAAFVHSTEIASVPLQDPATTHVPLSPPARPPSPPPPPPSNPPNACARSRQHAWPCPQVPPLVGLHVFVLPASKFVRASVPASALPFVLDDELHATATKTPSDAAKPIFKPFMTILR
jgi:hypothetical protein